MRYHKLIFNFLFASLLSFFMLTESEAQQITVIANTIGKPDQTFYFTTNLPGADSTFDITTSDGTGNFVSADNLSPGVYSVVANVPEGWDLSESICSNGSPTDAIDILAGEHVFCTFTFTQRGTIIVNNSTIPSGSIGFEFKQDIDFSAPINFLLDDAQSRTFLNVPAGSYIIEEIDPTLLGYELTDLYVEEQISNSIVDLSAKLITVNLEPGETIRCTFINTLFTVSLNISIFLEGSYNSGSMTNSLVLGGILPSAQPYNTAPWNYSGSEVISNDLYANGIAYCIVDWVLVELRTGTDANTKAASRACLLKVDGTIVDLDGTSSVDFIGLNPAITEYYTVVYHRNHLPVMSSIPVQVN
jgi:hypothetical protein